MISPGALSGCVPEEWATEQIQLSSARNIGPLTSVMKPSILQDVRMRIQTSQQESLEKHTQHQGPTSKQMSATVSRAKYIHPSSRVNSKEAKDLCRSVPLRRALLVAQ